MDFDLGGDKKLRLGFSPRKIETKTSCVIHNDIYKDLPLVLRHFTDKSLEKVQHARYVVYLFYLFSIF